MENMENFKNVGAGASGTSGTSGAGTSGAGTSGGLEGLKGVKGIFDEKAPTPLSHSVLANHLIKTNRSEMGIDDMVRLLVDEGLSDKEHAVSDASKVLGAIKDILEAKKLFKL